jgi:hypothetical protein
MTTAIAAQGGAQWANTIRARFITGIERFMLFSCERIPALIDTMHADEGKEAARKGERRWLDETGGNPEHAEDAMWLGVEAYLDHVDETFPLEQSYRNLAAAGIYHLFEQQLALLVPNLHGGMVPGGAKSSDFVQVFNTAGLNCPELTGGPIQELRLLANAIKHGEGRSSEELRSLRPDLLERDWFGDRKLDPKLEEPLAGQGIIIRMDQVRAYGAAIVAFWANLADQLEAGSKI